MKAAKSQRARELLSTPEGRKALSDAMAGRPSPVSVARLGPPPGRSGAPKPKELVETPEQEAQRMLAEARARLARRA